jgi:hypothetical protein
MLSDRQKMKLVSDIPNLEEHQFYLIKNILDKYKCKYTKNSTGIRINLKNVDEKVIAEIYSFVQKCKKEKKFRDGIQSSIAHIDSMH